MRSTPSSPTNKADAVPTAATAAAAAAERGGDPESLAASADQPPTAEEEESISHDVNVEQLDPIETFLSCLLANWSTIDSVYRHYANLNSRNPFRWLFYRNCGLSSCLPYFDEP